MAAHRNDVLAIGKDSTESEQDIATSSGRYIHVFELRLVLVVVEHFQVNRRHLVLQHPFPDMQRVLDHIVTGRRQKPQHTGQCD